MTNVFRNTDNEYIKYRETDGLVTILDVFICDPVPHHIMKLNLTNGY